jgi:hypothetical protein
MAHYRVRFLKKVCNDTGHEHRTCQSVIEVDADSSELAVISAQKTLSSRTGGMDCRFYYDEIEVEALRRKAEPQGVRRGRRRASCWQGDDESRAAGRSTRSAPRVLLAG